MTKTGKAPRKTSAPAGVASKRKSAAQKFRELPEAERRRRITAFLDDIAEQWKGSPKTEAVKFLIKLRRGE